ncbi:THAP domain-containing protein 1-like isoform X5 [Periplaneta americana]|uniref:THAP domain-containing protein 1-like isoform X5 n=1 Tax=Periplaneta americana TaxID=6978 RepID=UPI0037E9BDFE
MVNSCAAFNCTYTYKKGSGISLHKFPLENPELLSKWLSAVKRYNFIPSIHHRLCSVHFTQSCFWKSNCKRLLKADAVPTVFNFPAYLTKIEQPSRKVLKRKLESDKQETNEENNSCGILINNDQITAEHNYTYNAKKECELMEEKLKRKNGQIENFKCLNSTYIKETHKQDGSVKKLKVAVKELKERNLANEDTLAVVMVAMDVIKTEFEVDPLAVQSSRDTDDPSDDVWNLFAPHVSQTTMKDTDPSYALSCQVKIEETEEEDKFPVVKCEIEDETFDMITVKEENGLEETIEGSEVLTESCDGFD